MTSWDLDPNLYLPIFRGLARLLKLHRRDPGRRLVSERTKRTRPVTVDCGCRA